MENWGLLTFRSSNLLLGRSANLRRQQNVWIVIAHEIAHQVLGLLAWRLGFDSSFLLTVVWKSCDDAVVVRFVV